MTTSTSVAILCSLLGVAARGQDRALPAPSRTPALTTSFVKVETGLTLQVVSQGDPAGPPIVLLHGLGDSWHSWELVLPHLPGTFRVVAVTLRGHGLSDHPEKGYSHPDFASDVAALLKAMDLRGVTLVGHSLGSLVAQQLASTEEPGRIARLVLVGSGPGTIRDSKTAAELRDYFSAVRDPIGYGDFQAGTAYGALPPVFLETMIGEVQRVPARVFHEVASALSSPDAQARLKAIRVPTLLVWGDRDSIFTKADQDALLAALPDARLVTYRDTGHALHWEQPRRFATDLVAFAGRN